MSVLHPYLLGSGGSSSYNKMSFTPPLENNHVLSSKVNSDDDIDKSEKLAIIVHALKQDHMAAESLLLLGSLPPQHLPNGDHDSSFPNNHIHKLCSQQALEAYTNQHTLMNDHCYGEDGDLPPNLDLLDLASPDRLPPPLGHQDTEILPHESIISFAELGNILGDEGITISALGLTPELADVDLNAGLSQIQNGYTTNALNPVGLYGVSPSKRSSRNSNTFSPDTEINSESAPPSTPFLNRTNSWPSGRNNCNHSNSLSPLKRTKSQEICLPNAWNGQPNVVKISGHEFRRYEVPHLEPAHVAIVDVFRTFFSTRHWDEFKLILQSNHIEPVTVEVAAKDSTLFPESVQVVSVDQVQHLLLSNEARRDGFARCFKMNDKTGTLTPTVINAQEGKQGELVSGIKTRNANHSDIVYMEIEGVTLPSLQMGEHQYVRLVDVEKQLLSPRKSSVSTKDVSRLKAACSRLDIRVEKCTVNDKARLVVYANSCRHNSTHVIRADQLLRLVKAERVLRASAKFQQFQRKLNRKQGQLQLSESESDSDGEEGSEMSSLISSQQPSPAPSEAKQPDFGLEEQNDEGSVAPTVISSELHSEVPPAPKKRRKLYRQVPLIEREQVGYVPLNKDLGLLETVDVASNEARLIPFSVELSVSAALPVIVCGRAGQRGPVGKYFNHLFTFKKAQAIMCCSCKKFFSAREFVHHTHYTDKVIPDPRLFMYVDSPGHARFDLWQAFNRKLATFHLKKLAYLGLHEDLVQFYAEEHSMAPPPTRQPPSAALPHTAVVETPDDRAEHAQKFLPQAKKIPEQRPPWPPEVSAEDLERKREARGKTPLVSVEPKRRPLVAEPSAAERPLPQKRPAQRGDLLEILGSRLYASSRNYEQERLAIRGCVGLRSLAKQRYVHRHFQPPS